MGSSVDERSLSRLLVDVAEGRASVDEAVETLRSMPYEQVADAKVDHHRELRTGAPEAAYGPGKTAQQVADIVRSLAAGTDGAVLVTRATLEQAEAAVAAVPGAVFHEDARLVVVKPASEAVPGWVAVVAAGTSDLPVSQEAVLTLEASGVRVERIVDVGVAGIHRVLEHRATIATADVAIVVAGMEGALPSVVAGLTPTPVIAVPTSVGYGASFEGLAALLSMLSSCAPGVTVVNIDNGFGAAQAALRILRRTARAAEA